MSLDELMDLAADSPGETATMPIPKPLPTTPAAPRPLNPAAGRPTPAPQRAVAPVLADARRAYDASLERARSWLKEADNGLIAATALIAVLLLVVVAAL
jgi:hypothetical protein